ncbi:MAG: methyl-accepting chemotaxis protein [Pseudazoarcus pumilus]|nr:methyl-accepting chemotaxis protein [Pseudazoarcus pumilus]
MNNLSVRSKLIAAFGVIVLIIVLVIGVSLFSFDKSQKAESETVRTYGIMIQVEQVRLALASMESGLRGFSLAGSKEFLEPYVAGQERFAKALAEIRSHTTSEEALRLVMRIEQLEGEWRTQAAEPQIALREQINEGVDIMQSMEQLVKRSLGKKYMDELREVTSELINLQRKLLSERKETSTALADTTFYVLIGSGAIAALLSILMALGLAGNLGKRLRNAVEVAEATANGDLTVMVRADGRDEVSELMVAIAEMQKRLREMLGQIAEGAEQLAASAAQLTATANSLEDASDQQSEASSSMAAAVEELTVSINHVAEGANETATIARESDRIAGEGGEVLTRTVQSIQKISQRVETTSHDVEALVQQSDAISSIVNVIKEIAEQTNLLALNAAIEAARAGESGRGFAVVADEVRKLAERTAVSTQEIGTMIDEIQGGTARTVEAMRSSIAQVNEGVALANEAGDVIGRISQGARKVVEHAISISDALKEQTVASNDVAGNVERIAQMADENNRSVRETGDTVRNLEELGRTLKAAVQRFRLS